MILATTAAQATGLLAQLVGLAVLGGVLAAVTAFAVRWYTGEPVPRSLGLLVGLGGVAVYLNTTPALGEVIGGVAAPTSPASALFNVGAFLLGGLGAAAGRRAGDAVQGDVFAARRRPDSDTGVGRLGRTLGRVQQVALPEEIDDVVGYDPVPAETKAALGGTAFVFPRGLSTADLHDRLVTRLKTDYAVGHVDLDLGEDGTVSYLAVGSRASGIGPTLPPASSAVAVRADPAFSASAGDLVQVWATDPERRVLTAELRGVADDVVTLAVDAADAGELDPATRYRLVTLPVQDRPDREFASLLRSADETFSSVTVAAGSPLEGLPLGALAVNVVAVATADGTTTVLPRRETALAAGDVVFAVARPDTLRRLEVAAATVQRSGDRPDGRPGE
jgi:hypothetical protein